jgi:hypothetical protein
VIKTIDFTLSTHERFGIANVRSQIAGHLVRILEEIRKDTPVGGDDRILIIEHVEASCSVVRIDHNLDAVANVIEGVAGDFVMTGIRKVRRLRESVDHPEQPAIIGDHDVRVSIVSQKRRDAVDDLTNVPVNEHAAFAGDSV